MTEEGNITNCSTTNDYNVSSSHKQRNEHDDTFFKDSPNLQQPSSSISNESNTSTKDLIGTVSGSMESETDKTAVNQPQTKSAIELVGEQADKTSAVLQQLDKCDVTSTSQESNSDNSVVNESHQLTSHQDKKSRLEKSIALEKKYMLLRNIRKISRKLRKNSSKSIASPDSLERLSATRDLLTNSPTNDRVLSESPEPSAVTLIEPISGFIGSASNDSCDVQDSIKDNVLSILKSLESNIQYQYN